MSIFHELKKKNPDQLILENNLFFCLLDGFPVSPGHTLVIPQREVKSLMQLTNDEWIELNDFIRKVINKLPNLDLIDIYTKMKKGTENPKAKQYISDCVNHLESKGFEPDAYNHGINDGIAAGRTVHHLHWHIIPRFLGDVEDPRGGIRYIFPEKGNYKK
jgi:histidine triad (HIT) family protein